MYVNEDITMSLHKECFGGAAQDFVIRFKKPQTSINDIIEISSAVIKKLIHTYLQRGKFVKGRLVARVLYVSMTNDNIIPYYHPSYESERINNVEDFYTHHMLKIAQRMDNFNQNGSNLIINNIEEIHLHLSTVNSSKSSSRKVWKN